MNIFKSMPLHAFVHITKTGGTSLRHHFERHLPENIFYHLAKKGNLKAQNKSLKKLMDRDQAQQLQTKIIIGHEVNLKNLNLLPHTNKKLIVTFRNPESWIVSRYNQRMNRRVKEQLPIINFEKWLNSNEAFLSQFDWLFARFFGKGPQYKKYQKKERFQFIIDNINIFDDILFLESLDIQIKKYFIKMNIPTSLIRINVTGIEKKNYFINSQINQKLLKNHIVDDIQLFKQIVKYKEENINNE